MARNAEKAMAMMSRWTAMTREEGKVKERRPYLATECNDQSKAEKWRRQIIGEVSKKVAQIQNAGLGEFRIRDLNDEINKLLREKRHWEDRIVQLGGPDYKRVGPKMLDREGKEVPGNRGYKYFGAAKELPGVRELFEQAPPEVPRLTRGELMRNIDADYYGYRDEDDGVIVALEKEAEKVAISAAMENYKKRKEAGEIPEVTEEEDIYAAAVAAQPTESGDEDEDDDSTTQDEGNFVSHVPVPSQEEVEALLVQRKKMELLEKYASESLMKQSEEAKVLLGLQ